SAPAIDPMPGIRLEGTNNRTGILIHPGHPPTLYLSSIGCFNPTAPLGPEDPMNFWDSRERVIALINDLKQYAPGAFEHESMTRIANAWAVVDGEPMDVLDAPSVAVAAAVGLSEPASLPISKAGAKECCRWLLTNFGDQLKHAVEGKPYRVKHLCAIVCQ